MSSPPSRRIEGPVDFVFSFRSPFAWIAAHRVLPMLDPGLELRWRPFFPLPSFPNFPPLFPMGMTWCGSTSRLIAAPAGLLSSTRVTCWCCSGT